MTVLKLKLGLGSLMLFALLALVFVSGNDRIAQGASQATVTLDPSTRYQTMEGWEATGQGDPPCPVSGGCLDDGDPHYSLYEKTLAQLAVNQLGINRFRVEIYRKGVNGGNQNGNGFNLIDLDKQLDTLVKDYQPLLAARGERLWINICVVGSGYAAAPSGPNGTGYDSAALEVMRHIKSKYGFLPDSWEVALEPDNFHWGVWQNVAQALVATAKLFQANHLPSDHYFILPSDSSSAAAVSDFDQIWGYLQSHKLTQVVRELSYHRYSGSYPADQQAIATRVVQDGLNAAMLELGGANYLTLFQDLTTGRNSAWQAYALAGVTTSDNCGLYFLVDESNLNAITVQPSSCAKILRQYFHYIRRGAVRLGVTSANADLRVVAFANQNNPVYGSNTVVVVQSDTTDPGNFTLAGLPAGTYGLNRSDGNGYNQDLADQTIGAGGVINAPIPYAGAITIYGKAARGPSVTPTPGNSASVNSLMTGTLAAGKFVPTDTFKRGSRVAVRAHVIDSASANLSGVRVRSSLMKPNGTVWCTISATSGANGYAVGSCRVGRTAPAGNWDAHLINLSIGGVTIDPGSSVTDHTFVER